MKKLTAIILSLAFIISCVPAVLAAEEFTGYEYVFATGAVTGIEISGDSVTRDQMTGMTEANINKSVSDVWLPAGTSYISSTEVQSGGLFWRTTREVSTGYTSFAIKLKVEQGGQYIPKLSYKMRTDSQDVHVYLVPAGTTVAGKNVKYSTENFKFVTSTSGHGGDLYNFMTKDVSTYKLGHVPMYAASNTTAASTVAFDKINIASGCDYYLIFKPTAQNSACTKTSESYYQNTICGFTLEYVPSVLDEKFDYAETDYTAGESATVTALAAYGDGEAVEDSEVISVGTVTYGTSCTVSVKQNTVTKDNKEYRFSRWIRGAETGISNRKVLSTEESFGYMPSEGNNILIAVYEEVGTEKTEAFYNYNGQLLTDLKLENGKLPDLPSMPGFESAAAKWIQLGTEAELDAGADVSSLDGDKVFMAKYGTPKSDIAISINGASEDSSVTGTYTYGAEIICKAAAPEGKVFMYWTKTVADAEEAEIVSASEEYSFGAWEDCTVTAVYGESAPSVAKAARKIIISSVVAGSDAGIMAEFIGFDDALEKGIMIGTQKLAMTTNKTQFTLINDTKETSVVGYAIVKDSDGNTALITDGAAE